MKPAFVCTALSIIVIFSCLWCNQQGGKQAQTVIHSADASEVEIIDYTLDDFFLLLETKKSGIVYFGFAECPWCIEAFPILSKISNQQKIPIYYVNTKKEENLAEEKRAKMIEILALYLPKGENNESQLYVPDVYAIKNGLISGHHANTVEGHDPFSKPMTDDQRLQLEQFYTNIFRMIK